MLGHRLLDSVEHIVRVFLPDRHVVVELPTLVTLLSFVCPLGSTSEISLREHTRN